MDGTSNAHETKMKRVLAVEAAIQVEFVEGRRTRRHAKNAGV
jgi:ParB-like chromosome segregation protein Spo0J